MDLLHDYPQFQPNRLLFDGTGYNYHPYTNTELLLPNTEPNWAESTLQNDPIHIERYAMINNIRDSSGCLFLNHHCYVGNVTSEMLLERYSLLFDNVAKQHLIDDYFIDGEIADSAENARNYFGLITAITLKETQGNNKVELILKAAQTNQDAVRGFRAISEAFQREIIIYEKILTELVMFQRNFSISNPFEGIPRYYGSVHEALLMDNLKVSGYQLWNHWRPMDFDHMSLIVQEYAKLHAVSLAYGNKYPNKFKELIKSIKNNFLEQREAKNPELYQHQRDVVFKVCKKAVQNNATALKAVEKFKMKYLSFWNENKTNPEEDVLVVCHGDCHPGNILIKYKDIKIPEKICLIDWQLSSAASPIRDLSFALFTCASKEVLLRSNDLLELYHKIIEKNLREFGCEPAHVFSYSKFMEHWNKYFIYGLYRAVVVLKITLIAPEEQGNGSILDVIKKDFLPSSIFANRTCDLFETIGEKWLNEM
ncbi:hypothetical protein ABEB36_001485 [Hypothenemus hampei]|uniref:CHK kinase-like domain-containing protein n=1 Tax=Hypothenemus hampei TaxID=57062 RepID=A0ABD1FEQ1_HYPHA